VVITEKFLGRVVNLAFLAYSTESLTLGTELESKGMADATWKVSSWAVSDGGATGRREVVETVVPMSHVATSEETIFWHPRGVVSVTRSSGTTGGGLCSRPEVTVLLVAGREGGTLVDAGSFIKCRERGPKGKRGRLPSFLRASTYS